MTVNQSAKRGFPFTKNVVKAVFISTFLLLVEVVKFGQDRTRKHSKCSDVNNLETENCIEKLNAGYKTKK